MKLSYAYLNEHQEWAAQPADPCTAYGHTCRCPRPLPAAVQAAAEAAAAEHHNAEQRFRALFTAPARRERLAELDALTDQIGPLLDRLDATWSAVERDLDLNRGRRRTVQEHR